MLLCFNLLITEEEPYLSLRIFVVPNSLHLEAYSRRRVIELLWNYFEGVCTGILKLFFMRRPNR